MAQQSAPQPQPATGLPMFYRRPFALQAQVHSEVSLKRTPSYRFARETNAVPLTTQS